MMRLLNALRSLKFRYYVHSFLPKNLSRNHGRVLFVFFLVVGFMFAGMVSAVTVDTGSVLGDIGQYLINAVSWMLLGIAQIAIAITIFALKFFISLASYNNYIDVGIVKLGWVMVRDVANMFFVVALLVIAFATMLGLEKYEWKKGMAKLILMAILINFSNLIAQLVIDIAHVFTITFLNAVANTAGGNLIGMFHLDYITQMVNGKDFGTNIQEFNLGIFMASVTAVVFAVMAAITMGAYAIVMAIRVVVLWALIILSPIAFLMFAMPHGEAYAQEWWKEFSKHVIVAPIMVFFLWLAFATLGQGNILSQMQGDGFRQLADTNEVQSLSLSKVTTWENMAHFLLATVFLWIGIKKTQETGATGAGMVGGAIEYGKKVATIASGYAAGRWLVGKGAEIGIGAAKDYGTLGLAKVMDTKAGKALKTITGVKFLKESGIRRRAAMDKLEQYKKDKEMAIYQRGGGLAEKLAPSIEKRAQAAHDARIATTESDSQTKDAEAEVRLKWVESERNKYDKKEDNFFSRQAKLGLRSSMSERMEKSMMTEASGQNELGIIQGAERIYDEEYENLLKPIEEERKKQFEKRKEEILAKAATDGKKETDDDVVAEIAAAEAELLPVSEKERANLRRQAAKNVRTKGQEGLYAELLHRENEAKRPTNKAEAEQKRVLSGIVDEQRVQEGKARKALRAFEMGQIKEDLEDYEHYTYDELMEEIRTNLSKIRNFKELSKADQEKLKKDDPEAYEKYREQAQDVKNAKQNQGRAIASAYTKGYGEFLSGQLAKEQGFDNVAFNDGQNSHILDMALLSGKGIEDFGEKQMVKDESGNFVEKWNLNTNDDNIRAKQADIQEKIMKGMKEKKGILMRGLMVARDVDVSKHNSLESNHQLSVGRDKNGQKVITYSNLQGSGSYAGGKDKFSSGETKRSGFARRAEKYDFAMEGKRLKDIAGGSLGDGRTRRVKVGNKNVDLIMDFVNDEVRQMVADVGDMTAAEIKALSREQINRITGGQYDSSSYLGGEFVVGSDEMSKHLQGIFNRFRSNFVGSDSPAVKDNIKKAVRTFLNQAGEKDEAKIAKFIEQVTKEKGNIGFNDLIRVATEDEEAAAK